MRTWTKRPQFLKKENFAMKLNYKRTFLVGLAFLSICTFWQAYDSIIPLILKNTFQIGERNSSRCNGRAAHSILGANSPK